MTTILNSILPFILTLFITLAVLWGANWLLLRRRPDLSNEKKFPRQLVMLGLTIAGIVIVALSLPVSVSTRNQLIGFVGLVVSGIFAFSSTTLFANLVAGLMLRVTKPFRSGDFIRVKEYFGRIAERGLFDTEIQTETRELIAIPNTFLITNPVSVIRSSGTIISVSVSLGYDVHHSKLEPLLLEAAAKSGLEDPYVHVTDLGNFAITYKVHGMLKDIKSVITARSNLYRSLLDTLHLAGVEIVSPSFMNQRPLKDDQRFIPVPLPQEVPVEQAAAEALVFDKAEAAERRELEQLRLEKEIQSLEARLKAATEEEKARLASRLEATKRDLSALKDEVETPKQNDMGVDHR